MDIFAIAFYLFALLTLGSAVVMVFSSNIVYAAFALMFTLLGIAALFVLLYADFVAVTQLMVYVGGILILLLFGVMLTKQNFSKEVKSKTVNMLPASILTGLMAVLLITIYMGTPWEIVSEVTWDSTISALGVILMEEYILPFQVAGVLLLVAIIGAVLMTLTKKDDNKKNTST